MRLSMSGSGAGGGEAACFLKDWHSKSQNIISLMVRVAC